MRRFDLLVFDWDGTLVDSTGCIAGALQSACRDLGYAVPSDRDARYVIGLGLSDALAHVVPGIQESEYPQLLERYRHHFQLQDAGTQLFGGAVELLQELREAGYLLAVATGKSRRGLDRSMQATGLSNSFHATRCADEARPKPHPAMLQSLMQELGTRPERTLMIGDTTHDVEMARAASVHCLTLAHGAHETCDLLACTPLACLKDCHELRSWLAAER